MTLTIIINCFYKTKLDLLKRATYSFFNKNYISDNFYNLNLTKILQLPYEQIDVKEEIELLFIIDNYDKDMVNSKKYQETINEIINFIKAINIKNVLVNYHITDHNIGIGYARDEGIKLAKGEFIIFLDDDDIHSNVNESLDIIHDVCEKQCKPNEIFDFIWCYKKEKQKFHKSNMIFNKSKWQPIKIKYEEDLYFFYRLCYQLFNKILNIKFVKKEVFEYVQINRRCQTDNNTIIKEIIYDKILNNEYSKIILLNIFYNMEIYNKKIFEEIIYAINFKEKIEYDKIKIEKINKYYDGIIDLDDEYRLQYNLFHEDIYTISKNVFWFKNFKTYVMDFKLNIINQLTICEKKFLYLICGADLIELYNMNDDDILKKKNDIFYYNALNFIY